MLCYVYGLSVLTRTQDGRTARELAADSRKSFSDHMREAVAMAVGEDELLKQRRRALATAQGLANRHLPSLAIAMIGTLSEFPLPEAEGINKGIDQRQARQSKGRRKQ